MIGRIVEIANEGRYLSVDRGFMVVRHKREELGRIPLDDIAALICAGYGTTCSVNLLVELTRRGCPVVFCASDQKPAALLWPTESHHRQSARIDGQLAMSKPAKNQLWKQIVQSKIAMQAHALNLCGRTTPPLKALIRKVQSGDRSNVEGQAARVYWALLMPQGFHRDPDGNGINGILNYGYTILRALVARQIIAAGLHPGIGLHHANDGNAMRLVDDLMEPFRPIVDCLVFDLISRKSVEVTPEAKSFLASMATRTMLMEYGRSPVTLACQRLCISFAQRCESASAKLLLPHNNPRVLRALLDSESLDGVEAEDLS